MSDTKTKKEASNTSAVGADIYGENGVIRADFIDHILNAVDGGDIEALAFAVEHLHGSECAHLIEALEPAERQDLVGLLGERFDFSALTEVDEAIRMDIVTVLPNEQIALALQQLDTDDAVFILEDMDEVDQVDILSKIPFAERIRLRRSLDYPEESAGRRMQTEFVAVPPFWTVGQTIDYLRDSKDLPDSFTQLYVVDPTFKLIGAVDLDKILRAGRTARVEDIWRDTRHAIPADLDQEEAAHIFEQYDLLSAAVVDENDRLVGVLTIDDIVDVIQQEAEEDFKRLAGIGDEELSDNVIETTKSRFIWLLVNLGTAIIASYIIGLFDVTIEKMVALAVLMPIVASMGGNAGTQTMTVAVRALATKDIDIYNSGRIIKRELTVGLINGMLFALLIGVMAAFWFSNVTLGVIIAIAMIINMVSAALAGILIPLLLAKLDIDPASASSVFVTTVTDVVGFFAFLGLAALFLV